MSIFPKVIRRGKRKLVTLHMHLENMGEKDINGQIFFNIIDPCNINKVIKDKIKLKGLSKINKYYKYPVEENAPVGRYYVDGKFRFGREEVQSETHKNDFFDVAG